MGVWGRGKTVVYIYGAGSGADLLHFFWFQVRDLTLCSDSAVSFLV